MKTLLFSLVFLLSSLSAYAEIALVELYGLRDRAPLQQLIETESTKANTPIQKKRLGIAWHNLAVLEESGASEKAFSILDALTKELPEDYEVLAYSGSARTMVGRDTWNFFNKLPETNAGIATLDKAASKDKNNVAIRLLRANNSLLLPAFIGRREMVKPDLAHIITLLPQQPEITAISRSEIYLKMAQELIHENKTAEAQPFLQQAIDAAPESRWAKDAQALLHD